MSQFNTSEFNSAQFNAGANYWISDLNESMAITHIDEFDIITIIAKALSDGASISDVLTKIMTTTLSDYVVPSDDTKRKPSKGFFETIKVSIWLTVKRINSANWRD